MVVTELQRIDGAFNCKIGVGDLVVYPGRQSSSLYMTLGRVKSIHQGIEGGGTRELPVVKVERLVLQRYGLQRVDRSYYVEVKNCVRVDGMDFDVTIDRMKADEASEAA